MKDKNSLRIIVTNCLLKRLYDCLQDVSYKKRVENKNKAIDRTKSSPNCEVMNWNSYESSDNHICITLLIILHCRPSQHLRQKHSPKTFISKYSPEYSINTKPRETMENIKINKRVITNNHQQPKVIIKSNKAIQSASRSSH